MTTVLALLVVVFAAVIYHFVNKEKHNNVMRANDDVMKLVEMIERYRLAYGVYPIIRNDADEQPGEGIMDILVALKSPLCTPSYSRVEKLNPNMINFAEFFIGRRTINGMIVDPWGEPYHVAIDTNEDGITEICRFGNIDLRIHQPVLVWSNGPNRRNDFGLGDDICNWDKPAY